VTTRQTIELPASARLAWWGTAWLRGSVVTDLVVDAVIGDDATHKVLGLSGADVPEGIATALGALRTAGVEHLGLAWPAEGDPAGLGGPPELNAAALEAGEAVLAGARALVPVREGAVVFWHAYAARPRPLTDVGEADRTLRGALVGAANELAALEVARWRPEVADELMALRTSTDLVLPHAMAPRAVRLAGLAARCRVIVELALEDDGGAVTATEIDARREALLPLDHAARRGLVAACAYPFDA